MTTICEVTSGDVELTAEAHGEVGTAPEEVGHGTTACNVSVPPGNVSDSLLAANVGQAALVRVVEGLDVLDAAELALVGLDLLGNLGSVAGLQVQVGAELLDALLEGLGSGHVVEEFGKEVTLLCGDLGSRGVSGHGAIANGPDVTGALNNEVLIDGQTAAGVLLGGDLGDEVADDGADRVTGSPDEKTIGNGEGLLLSVGAGTLGLDVGVGDLLDHGLGQDVNFLLLKGLLGVLDQLLGEGGQNVGKSLDQGDLEAVGNLGDQTLDVLLEEVLKLTGELDTSGATTNDNHVHETANILGRLILEGGGLDAVHDLLANSLGVVNLLQEARVLAYAGDAKGGVLSSDTDDQEVVGDLSLGCGALNLRRIQDLDNLPLGVDGAGLGFVELDGGLLVTEDGSDGLHDGAVLNRAGGAGRQKRGEEEVVSRRNDDDVVVFRVELLQERDGSPASACCKLSVCAICVLRVWMPRRPSNEKLTENDQRLLGRVQLDLILGVSVIIDNVSNVAEETQGREVGQAPGPSEGLADLASLLGSDIGVVSGKLARNGSDLGKGGDSRPCGEGSERLSGSGCEGSATGIGSTRSFRDQLLGRAKGAHGSDGRSHCFNW